MRELFPGQAAHDRNDLIARAFRLKSKAFTEVITKGHLFGQTSCDMHTIEWQKRGLPHMHALFWLTKTIAPTDVDQVVRAEIPSPEEDPVLHDLVTKHMIHGPCGALNTSSPCMNIRWQVHKGLSKRSDQGNPNGQGRLSSVPQEST